MVVCCLLEVLGCERRKGDLVDFKYYSGRAEGLVGGVVRRQTAAARQYRVEVGMIAGVSGVADHARVAAEVLLLRETLEAETAVEELPRRLLAPDVLDLMARERGLVRELFPAYRTA